MNINEAFSLAWQSVRRNMFLSSTVVLIMTLTFFITSVFVVAASGANSLLGYLESKAQITVFFKNDVPADKILAIRDELDSSGKVSEVTYISQEDALKIYLGQHKDEPTLLESVSASIFPASLQIRAKNIADLPLLAKDLESKDGVEEVSFFKDVVNTFRHWTETARLAGIVFIAVLSLISILITLVIIGMTIFTRAEEIEVMRLVGATAWYIRLPFLLQGAFYGALSAVFSCLLTLLAIPIITPYFNGLFAGSSLALAPAAVGAVSAVALLSSPLFLAELFLAQLLFGVLLGVLGSTAAIRKYLRL